MTYRNCKKTIQSGSYIKENMQNMLDVFLLRNRITQGEYVELIDLMKGEKNEENTK